MLSFLLLDPLLFKLSCEVFALLSDVPKPYLGPEFFDIIYKVVGSYAPGPGTIYYVLLSISVFDLSMLAPILEKCVLFS